MVVETPNPEEHLLPIRHSNADLFICDVADAVLKDLMPHMEHPFFTLAKQRDTKIRRYEHNGEYVEIVPSVKGLATIYDKDILIYCISQIMHKLKRGEKVSQRLCITAHDLLIFTNRGTAGKDYNSLCEALDRLEGTRIRTNIKTDEEEQRSSFGLIDASLARRKHGLDGRLLSVEVKLSDWVFNAIRGKEVLTLHRDYFRLGRPLERRIYELARKHCGRQSEFTISLVTLRKKSGIQSALKYFRGMIREMASHDHLPDYRLVYEEATDNVTFFNRGTMWDESPLPSSEGSLPSLSSETYEAAREAAPLYDVYALERDWRDWWVTSGKPKLENAGAAFVGFCRARNRRAPLKRSPADEWEESPRPRMIDE
jgi:plasmid replication initiation protein